MERALGGKVALVTGAAQGIGRALALGLGEAGATVVASDLTAPGIVHDIRAAGGEAHAIELDIADPDSIETGFSVLDEYGGVDIVVNNAGIFPRRPVIELEPEEWDHVMHVNLRGTYLCSRAAAWRMRAQGRGGRIVNVTSGAAFVPTSQSAAYAASKAGIVAFTRVLALEVAADGVTVNALAPGLTDTAQPRSFYSDEQLRASTARIPAGRLGEPADMVGAVVFLCGDGASYITGQTIHVNGGLYMP
jgi:NAD(P)-dependent dehydrogenase (short-subunit alcohol dehydrogenase family)